MSFPERMGDAQIEMVIPSAEDVLAAHDLTPTTPQLQKELVRRWTVLTELERELLSEAAYV